MHLLRYIAAGAAAAALFLAATSCRHSSAVCDSAVLDRKALTNEIDSLLAGVPAQVGVAVIVDGTDTVTVNNSADYPMMSMFKLHEAIAVCRTLGERGQTIDTVFNIPRSALHTGTWSPMLKDYTEDTVRISARGLLDYLLVHSDNNASNLLFSMVATAPQTDSIIRGITSDGSFNISNTEAQMQREHNLAYANRTSPLAYAVLVDRLFTDSLASAPMQEFIKDAMSRCDTGTARLQAGLPDKEGVKFAHRTGSGYVNEHGEVVAVNDGGQVTLPDGRSYSVAVFVKNYAGQQEDAEAVIARISEAINRHIHQ